MGATIIILLVFCLVTIIGDGCPTSSDGSCVINSSCCRLINSKFNFTRIHTSGVYYINRFCGECKHVVEGYCDSSTAGGGWLVVQRRQDGSVDFNRGWVDYEDGFGSLTGEFWYGLRPLHCLTNQGQWELRIDFTLTNGTKSYISYSSFKVGPASNNYQLNISGFKGITSRDPFSTHQLNGMPFTTKDRDNDKWGKNCAVDEVGNAGGWWYNHCSHIHFNHQIKNTYGIVISGWKSFSFTEMKIRPLNCNI